MSKKGAERRETKKEKARKLKMRKSVLMREKA